MDLPVRHCACLQLRHFRSQYLSHWAQMSYPSIAPRMKSSSGESMFKGRVTMSLIASRHSFRPKNKLTRSLPTGCTM